MLEIWVELDHDFSLHSRNAFVDNGKLFHSHALFRKKTRHFGKTPIVGFYLLLHWFCMGWSCLIMSRGFDDTSHPHPYSTIWVYSFVQSTFRSIWNR